jgi:hypothetical protein
MEDDKDNEEDLDYLEKTEALDGFIPIRGKNKQWGIRSQVLKRKCLRCNKEFVARNRFIRLCINCRQENKKLYYDYSYPISREYKK